MDRNRLETILDRFPELKIAVLGDFFLDKWLEIDRDLDELSVETNLTAYQVVKKRLYAGAAGNVLSNLAALEAGKLYAIGFLGEDGEGFELLRIFESLGVDTKNLHTSGEVMTPAYTKPVFCSKNSLEESNRLDHRNINPTPVELEQKIIDSMWEIAPRLDALIALDQLTSEGYGVITPKVRLELAKLAEKYPKIVLYADSRAFIDKFRNMIIKCNNIEAMKIINPSGDPSDTEEVKNCIQKFAANNGRTVFISCGSKGIMALNENNDPVLVPAVPLPPETKIDIVGAGDACNSGIVTSLCCGASCEEAAFVGNLVSSNTIQVIGTTGTATRDDLLAMFDRYY